MAKTTPLDAAYTLQGTLEMLVLTTLINGNAHGHTIAHSIEYTSESALEVEQGSLYPALHDLEDRGLVLSQWRISDVPEPTPRSLVPGAARSHLAAHLRRINKRATALKK